MKLQVRRKFCASHVLNNPNQSPEWNKSLYGKCNNLHGHTWTAEVEVDGLVITESGLIINFQEIKRIVDELDHAHLNDFLPIPTAEHVTSYLLKKIVDLDLFKYVRVRIFESDDSYIEDSWQSV